MRIEYVAGIECYGGFSTYSSNLATELTKNQSIEIMHNGTGNFLGVPIFLRKKIKSDLTHFTNQEIISPFVAKNKKFVVTVHDLTVKKLKLFNKSKNKFSFLASKLYDFKLSCLKNSKKIIAVSQNTKNDLVEELEIDEDKIKVIYEGVSSNFKQIQNSSKIKHSILYVGNELPHKNIPNLLRAIKILKNTYPDIKLIKVGSSGWKGAREELITLANKLGISNNIIFKNSVKNLVEEYNSAEVFVMPSLYEGFGLPVLEAMACGCPVITANTSSMFEVAGNATIPVNPLSIEEIKNAIEKLLTDKKSRERLINKGFEQAKKFSWKKTAEETLKIYENYSRK